MLFSKKKVALKADERLVFELRSLYNRFGYTQYRMSKFEEYELYIRNKDFLLSSGVITFTDTNGKLMALKPDVTLSIIKSLSKQTGVHKVNYNENVYRVSKHSGRFREIMQTGLECLGDIGEYEISETLLLALKSLELTKRDFRIDVAHMGILSELISKLSLPKKTVEELFVCIKRKNTEGIKLCISASENKKIADTISEVIGIYGVPEVALPKLKEICGDFVNSATIKELETILSNLSSTEYSDKIYIDFSVVNDMNYYNGIVFKGYVDGVPDDVLSGGCYDLMMKKIGRDCGAIGFAVCLDSLERLDEERKFFDYDIVLVYGDTPSSEVLRAVNELSSDGSSVFATESLGDGVRASKIFYIQNNELTEKEGEEND